MTRIDDNAVDPFGVPQLSTSQEHLVWSDRNLCRRRARQGSREVKSPIVCVERRVGRFGEQVASEERRGVGVREGGSGWVCLFNLQVGFAAVSRNISVDSPIQVRCFNVAKTIGFTAAQQYHVCRDEAVGRQTNDISNSYSSPWSRFELLVDKNFGQIVVEVAVGRMTFEVFLSLFESTRQKYNAQRDNGGVSPSRRHVGHLLDAGWCERGRSRLTHL